MATGAEVASALTYATTSARMFEDPDLRGNLLLLAQAILHEIAQRTVQKRSTGWSAWEAASELIRKPSEVRDTNSWLRWTLSDDVPRYEMSRPLSRACMGTMLRPPGAPCKRSYTVSGSIPDPATGERSMVGACSNPRHQAEFDAVTSSAWAAWKAAGSITPAQNRGGVLPRYFKSDWDEIYKWASYGRYDPVVRPGSPEPSLPRARLRLVPPLVD